METETQIPWLNTDELRTWRAMLSAQAMLVAALDRELLSEHDLGLADYDVFVQLSEAKDGSLRMADLARAVLLSPSGLTRRLDGLVRNGYVERKPCPSDGRGLLAVLTEAGYKKLETMAPTHLRGVRAHFIDLIEPEDTPAINRMLDKIIENQRPSVSAATLI